MDVLIRAMQPEDAALMAEEMRPMDVFEFDVMSGGQPVTDSLAMLQRRSARATAAFVDGRLVAVYGIVSPTMLSTDGNPWLCATDEIERPAIRRAFIKHTHGELARMAGGFRRLWNFVSAENKIAIRWLKWAGFSFAPAPVDVQGHPFLRFEMEF